MSPNVKRFVLCLAILTGLTPPATVDAQQPSPASAPARADAQPEQILDRMELRSSAQQAALQSVRQLRRYHAENRRLRKEATLLVEYEYTAPDRKTFRVLERSGSGSVQKKVFDPMLKAEADTAAVAVRQAAELHRRNYCFQFLGFDAEERAYVFAAEPRTANRYLFRGRVWIDPDDYAVRKIEGEPAQRPSFWVRKTHFVHLYGRYGHYWFPLSNQTEVELRLLGRSEFSIEYFDHQWRPRVDATALPVTRTPAWTIHPSPPLADAVRR
jgi:hypothetical protein